MMLIFESKVRHFLLLWVIFKTKIGDIYQWKKDWLAMSGLEQSRLVTFRLELGSAREFEARARLGSCLNFRGRLMAAREPSRAHELEPGSARAGLYLQELFPTKWFSTVSTCVSSHSSVHFSCFLTEKRPLKTFLSTGTDRQTDRQTTRLKREEPYQFSGRLGRGRLFNIVIVLCSPFQQ